MADEFFQIEVSEDYQRVVQSDGVRITLCRNRFEIIVLPRTGIWEQSVVQALRQWVRWREEQEKLQESRDLSE